MSDEPVFLYLTVYQTSVIMDMMKTYLIIGIVLFGVLSGKFDGANTLIA